MAVTTEQDVFCWWWEDKDLIVQTEDGKFHRLRNAYISAINFSFDVCLESNMESVTLRESPGNYDCESSYADLRDCSPEVTLEKVLDGYPLIYHLAGLC